jgi:hypothetical protein
MTEKELQEVQDRARLGTNLKHRIKELEGILKKMSTVQNLILEYPPREGEFLDCDEDECVPEEILEETKDFISQKIQAKIDQLKEDFSNL